MNSARSFARSILHSTLLACLISPVALVAEPPFGFGGVGSSNVAMAATGTSAENKAAARDLAIEGIRLAEAGDCQSAVPKLERAEKLYHAITILAWVGKCQLQMGKLVEGTETLNRVVREKLESDAPDAYTDAQKNARELIAKAKPNIARLTIRVMSDQGELHDLEGLEVQVDSVAISQALVGAARPSDPGTHQITAIAPGYHQSQGEVELAPGSQKELVLTLKLNAQAQTSIPPTASGASESDGSTRKIITWSLIGGGAALMAGGGVVGLLALNQKNDLECDSNQVCDPSQQDTLNGANTKATVSTILFGVGGAAAATGIVLLLTDSEPQAQVGGATVKPTLGFGSVGISGRF